MKVIIAVSRDIISYEEVCKAVLNSGVTITELLYLVVPGVTTLPERWAAENNVPVKAFEAEKAKFGHRAGPILATKICQEADALIVVWDGKSKSVRYLMNAALDNQTVVYTHIVTGE